MGSILNYLNNWTQFWPAKIHENRGMKDWDDHPNIWDNVANPIIDSTIDGIVCKASKRQKFVKYGFYMFLLRII